jgi:hypothetical protein
MGIDEVRDLINAAGYQMKFVPLSSSVDDAPELEDVLATTSDEDFERLAAPVIRNKAQNRLVLLAAKGEFDKLKQLAFYVDVAEEGQVLREPSSIDRDTTDRIIRLASRTLTTIKAEFARRSRIKKKSV